MKKYIPNPIKWLEEIPIIPILITLLIAIFIFYISSQQFAPMQNHQVNNLRAVTYHFGIFFVFAFFLSISLIKRKNTKLFPLAIIIGVIYAVSDEVHQYFVPGRACTFKDILIDSIGVLLASTLYLYTSNRTNNLSYPSA